FGVAAPQEKSLENKEMRQEGEEVELYIDANVDEKEGVEGEIESEADFQFAQGLGNKPFAEGGTRFAYLGRYTCKKKKGRPCVVKKYKHNHYFTDDVYKGDMECGKLAAKLVEKWNATGRMREKYEIITPRIAKKGGDLGLLFGQLLETVLAPEDEITLNRVNNLKDKILLGETVLIEDYLKGDYVKWNSNNGWIDTMKNNSSIQAFCHWTYHQSNGKYLFCDAQGVRRKGKYILTDPCIVSMEGYIYGPTDIGKEYLWNWFLNHKCHPEFCDPSWKKPTREELASVPDYIKALEDKCTSHIRSRGYTIVERDRINSVLQRPSRSDSDVQKLIRILYLLYSLSLFFLFCLSVLQKISGDLMFEQTDHIPLNFMQLY
ncbi:hypothetical protein RFI_18086, partial [Reticulomyxa filosa]